MKTKIIKVPSQYQSEIDAVVEEFLDWKDVYSDKIPDDHQGVIIFATNDRGKVLIDWRLEQKGIKLKARSYFDRGDNKGMKGQVVWIDS